MESIEWNPDTVIEIWNPLSGIRNSVIGIWNPVIGIRNPVIGIWNPLSGIRNLVIGIWNRVIVIWNPISGIWNPDDIDSESIEWEPKSSEGEPKTLGMKIGQENLESIMPSESS